MSSGTVAILGGYGGAGRAISRLLLQETDVSIVIAGRRLGKAEEFARQLSEEFPGRHVSGVFADAASYESLLTAFHGATLALVASPTTHYARQVAEAAIASRADYLDIYFPQRVVPILKALVPAIEEGGRCFITQAGLHPGLPSVLVRYAAPNFDRYQRAAVAMAMNVRVERTDSLYELIDEIGDYRADVFREGEWRKGTYKDARKVDFGPPFGTRSCYPIFLEEMRPLPEMFGLEEVGLYVAGFNWFVDYIVFPFAQLLFRIKKGLGRHLLASMLAWGTNAFAPPGQGVCVVLYAEGQKNGKAVRLRLLAEHDDPYLLTAIPVVACLLQYLDGSIAKPGLWMMGHAVEPIRFLNDMQRMGIRLHKEIATAGGD